MMYSLIFVLDLIGPLMEQPEYNMFKRDRVEAEYDELYRKHGLGLTIFSPLRRGILTGKYNDGNIAEGSRAAKEGGWFKDEILNGGEMLGKVKKLSDVTAVLGELNGKPVSTGQLALAWTIKNENVSSAIIGATSIAQVEENLAAVELVQSGKMTDEVMKNIEAILDNKPKLVPKRYS